MGAEKTSPTSLLRCQTYINLVNVYLGKIWTGHKFINDIELEIIQLKGDVCRASSLENLSLYSVRRSQYETLQVNKC